MPPPSRNPRAGGDNAPARMRPPWIAHGPAPRRSRPRPATSKSRPELCFLLPEKGKLGGGEPQLALFCLRPPYPRLGVKLRPRRTDAERARRIRSGSPKPVSRATFPTERAPGLSAPRALPRADVQRLSPASRRSPLETRAKSARAHRDISSKVFNAERRGKMATDVIEQRREASIGALLSSSAENCDCRRAGGDRRPIVAPRGAQCLRPGRPRSMRAKDQCPP